MSTEPTPAIRPAAVAADTTPAGKSELRPLRESARMIRSRNAGSYLMSIDVAFPSEARYVACRDAGSLDPDTIAGLYQVPVASVHVISHDPSHAIKVTLPRQAPSGAAHDTDIDSSQQYVPLLAIMVPVPIDDPDEDLGTDRH